MSAGILQPPARLLRHVHGWHWAARIQVRNSSSGSTGMPQSSKLSWMLLPTKKTGKKGDTTDMTTSTDMLTKAGYIHQSSAGIYTLMPLAQRVMDKIERIVDDEMQAVGGQKLAMPTLLVPDNWKRTGRWQTTGDELFTLKDRKQATLILGPTHEEEIAAIVKATVRGFRELPLRLYQITRKFRDEARPRGGLLRAREFVMKDMYSFDVTRDQAIDTFHKLERAYRRCFDRIGVPYAVADADSGNIGGSLSKEFHFVHRSGEDTVLKCGGCGYTANEERARGSCTGHGSAYLAAIVEDTRDGGSKRMARRLVVVPADHEPSALKIRQAWPIAPGQRLELTPVAAHEATALATDADMLAPLVDTCASAGLPETSSAVAGDWHVALAGDSCSQCTDGRLASQRAIEVGHIFYLGDRYSRAMDLTVMHRGTRDFVQMGCYGIGVSRVLQAAAECCSSPGAGLRWPVSIAPFMAAIVPLAGIEHAAQVYDALTQVVVGGRCVFDNNVAVDDRDYLSPGFRLHDAQLLGFPVTLVLGKAFAATGSDVEVQLRLPLLQQQRLPAAAVGIRLAHSNDECRAHVPLHKLGEFLSCVLA
ncbi:hypothetical protein FB645_002384 [Coemansia sp. IMI 203386]|nr:hypothetical protein FB645_002384 [Coemansia sp. IMI 203386]